MENQITITLENGDEVLADIILTYHDDDTSLDYVIFEMPDETVSAARYTDDGTGNGSLSDLETDEEWELVNNVLQDYYDTLEDSKLDE